MESKKLYCDRDWLYEQYIILKKSTVRIAEEAGCANPTVGKWLKRHGIPVRSQSEAMGCPVELQNKDWLYEQYVLQNKNMKEIAEELGCGHNTVFEWVKRHNLTKSCPTKRRKLNYKYDRLLCKELLYDIYVTQKKSTVEIAALLNCSHASVWQWLNRHNIPTRSVRESRLSSQELTDPLWLKNEYVINEKTTEEIADDLGCAPQTVLNWLNAHNIDRINAHPCGPNSSAWRGGVSFEPYCPKFNEKRKEKVRDNFNRRCAICGCPENGKKLSVHHIDYNKMQGCTHGWNLVPLCPNCHSKTNSNRWFWFNLLQNWWLDNEQTNFTGFARTDVY